MKLKKSIIGYVLLAGVLFTQSGCSLFKKKCDCPSWGHHTNKPAPRQAC
jgi:hypothetical protein